MDIDNITKRKLQLLHTNWCTDDSETIVKNFCTAIGINSLHTKVIEQHLVKQLLAGQRKGYTINNISPFAGKVIRAQIYVGNITTKQLSYFLQLTNNHFKEHRDLRERILALTVSSHTHSFVAVNNLLEDGYCERTISTIILHKIGIQKMNSITVTEKLSDLLTQYDHHKKRIDNNDMKLKIFIEDVLNSEIIYEGLPECTAKDIIMDYYGIDRNYSDIAEDNEKELIAINNKNMYEYTSKVPSVSALVDKGVQIGASKYKLVDYVHKYVKVHKKESVKEQKYIYIRKFSKVDFLMYKHLARVVPEMKAELSLYLHLIRDSKSYNIIVSLGLLPNDMYSEIWTTVDASFPSTHVHTSLKVMIECIS